MSGNAPSLTVADVTAALVDKNLPELEAMAFRALMRGDAADQVFLLAHVLGTSWDDALPEILDTAPPAAPPADADRIRLSVTVYGPELIPRLVEAIPALAQSLVDPLPEGQCRLFLFGLGGSIVIGSVVPKAGTAERGALC